MRVWISASDHPWRDPFEDESALADCPTVVDGPGSATGRKSCARISRDAGIMYAAREPMKSRMDEGNTPGILAAHDSCVEHERIKTPIENWSIMCIRLEPFGRSEQGLRLLYVLMKLISVMSLPQVYACFPLVLYIFINSSNPIIVRSRESSSSTWIHSSSLPILLWALANFPTLSTSSTSVLLKDFEMHERRTIFHTQDNFHGVGTSLFAAILVWVSDIYPCGVSFWHVVPYHYACS